MLKPLTDSIKQQALKVVREIKEGTQSKWNLLAMVWEELHPVWKTAKQRFTRNKKNKLWAQMIQASFSKENLPLDLEELPLDLIKRLGNRDNYSAMPSSIALEHAAHFLGFPPNAHSGRTLEKHLQESKKWLREHPEKSENLKRVFCMSERHEVQAMAKAAKHGD
jgi:hypothetical protein